VSDLCHSPIYFDINFTLHYGEILGIIGPLGAGKTELALSLFGIIQPSSGSIYVKGKKVNLSSPNVALKNGIAYVPEDRNKFGIVHNMEVLDNLTLSILRKIERMGVIDRNLQIEIGEKYVNLLGIKTPNLKQIINFLSGGNTQKVIIGKWLAVNPEIIIFDQPTRGLDIKAKEDIKKIIRDLSNKGLSIIYISMEVPEIIEMCDRILVMKGGKTIDELLPNETSKEELTTITLGEEKVNMRNNTQ
jgi:ABC-type sugar transport system ATPase subunit